MYGSRYLPILLLGLILFLGAFLRFYRQGELAAFRADQAIELSAAYDILSGKLTLIGIKTSNSEVRNGAVMYYLLAPFLYFFHGDPRAGGVLQSLLSLGTIIVVYLIAKKDIGAREALLASFLTAASSLLVIYSRQTMLAFYPLFFNSLVFLVCLRLVQKYRPFLAIALGFLLGITMQIHYSTVALVIASFVIPPFFLDRKIWFNYYIFLFLGFLLGLSPMIIFELRHDFFNTKMLLALLRQSSGRDFLTSLNSLTVFWQDALSRLLFGGNILFTRIYFLVLAGAIAILRKKVDLIQKLALLFVLFSIVFTILFSRDIRPPYEYISHYALVSFLPLIFLTSWLLGKLPPIFLYLAAILFLVINFPGYGLFDSHGYSHSVGWGLVGIGKAANLIKNDLTDRPYNVVMLVDAENQGYPLRYLLSKLPNRPLPINAYDQAVDLYVLTEPGLDLNRVDLWEVNSFGPFEITKTWPIQNGYLLNRLTKLTPTIRSSNFLTLIYPVRGTGLWVSPDLKPLNRLLLFLDGNNLPATFLFQYDALTDRALVNRIRSGCPHCEFGILLEVSEELATDSLVSYKVGDGSWARPDKTFLSGYNLLDRKKLIDQAFSEFKAGIGYFPVSVGGWYVDPYSLSYLNNKYKVTTLVSVADQYDTDAQRYWGRPWGVPYYSQKYDLMSPATSPADKLDMVQIQWAQRHPTDAIGNGVWYSQNSLQANDYINNGKKSDYFAKLLGYYLDNDANPVNQVTIGLEVGQELTSFEIEHFRQLAILEKRVTTSLLQAVTLKDFSQWYRHYFPGLSPVTFISDGTTTWVNAPCYRAAVKGNTIFDLRPYQQNTISPDSFTRDDHQFLSREVPAINVSSTNETGSREFLASFIKFGRITYDFSLNCQRNNIDQVRPRLKTIFAESIEKLNDWLSLFKRSRIDGQPIIGLAVRPDTLLGVWWGKGIGLFSFPFQTLAKFQSPSIMAKATQ